MESPPQNQSPEPARTPICVRDHCLRILEQGDLETKLAAPIDADGLPLPDSPSGPAVEFDRPARDPGLRMHGGSDRLPRPGQLREPEQRIHCLARFAHHELQAVELFAWALVRWPDLPAQLRRGLLAALVDEQRHCRLYLDRLEAHGGQFENGDHSDYFWRQVPAIAASPAGPRAFLAAIGLTLEQANLDFTLTYRDGFSEAGDVESASVCQIVHDDEIAHVMGHEISHALANHTAERMSVAMASQLGLTGLAIATSGNDQRGAILTGTSLAAALAITLPNSRTSETEADVMGIEIAARAGYDPRAAATLWQKMGEVGGKTPPQFLSTHPAPANRQENLSKLAEQLMPYYLEKGNRPVYMLQ
jgi:uncharacterized ferritin-like protein (DUF455 family)